MPKQTTELQKSLGKLITAIQKEWGEQLGVTDAADFTQCVMGAVHDLRKAKTADSIIDKLGTLTLRQYIGEVWIKAHPIVMPAIIRVEKALESELTKIPIKRSVQSIGQGP